MAARLPAATCMTPPPDRYVIASPTLHILERLVPMVQILQLVHLLFETVMLWERRAYGDGLWSDPHPKRARVSSSTKWFRSAGGTVGGSTPSTIDGDVCTATSSILFQRLGTSTPQFRCGHCGFLH